MRLAFNTTDSRAFSIAGRLGRGTADRQFVLALFASLLLHGLVLSLGAPPRDTGVRLPVRELQVSVAAETKPRREAAAGPSVERPPAAPAAGPVANGRRLRGVPHTAAAPSSPSIAIEAAPGPAAPASSPSTLVEDRDDLNVALREANVAAREASAPASALPPPRKDEDSAGTTTDDLLEIYGQRISQALGRYKEYPRIARMRGWEGSVTMRLKVTPSGRLMGADLYRSSGHDVLDRQALAMASKTDPLPAPPEGLRDGDIVVLVPIVFHLEP